MKYDGEVVIGAKLDTKGFDKQIQEATYELDKLQKKEKELTYLNAKLQQAQAQGKGIAVSEKELKIMQKLGISMSDIGNKNTFLKLQGQIQRYNNKILDLTKKQEELSKSDMFKNIGKGIDSTIRKVARWSLAVIGVRSVYLGIRRAMSTLGQYDDSITARTEYLRWVLANTLKPVIEWIIKALYSIVGLVGKIIYAITGKNIFENSGIGDYEKALKNSNKSAKELKKTLTGFDEMNVLNEDGSVGVGGKLPSAEYDLSKGIGSLDGITTATKKAVDAFYDYRKATHDALEQPELFDEAYGEWSYFMQGLVLSSAGILDTISGLGEMIGGILDIIVGIFTLNGKKIMEGINWLISGIIDTIGGVFEFVTGILKMLIGVVIGILGELWKLISGLFDSIGKGVEWAWNSVKDILGGIGTWVYNNIIKPVGDFFAGMWEGLKQGARDAWEGIKSIFGAVASFFKEIFTNAWEGVKAVFSTGGKIFTGIKDGILEGFKRIVNVIIDGINKVVAIPFNGINKAFDGLRSVDLWGWKPFEWVPKFNVPQLPKLAKGGIINNPGPGVAIGGEVSREGVIPLTDSQQMSLLGQEIGKYINLKATIPVYVGNRQIAREVRRIDAEDNFAFNG